MVEGMATFYFGMPMCPDNIDILIYDKAEGDSDDSQVFKVIELAEQPINEIPLFVDSLTRDFIKFAEEFSLKAGYLPIRNYSDPKGQFLIEYMDKIPVSTPARIHKTQDFIQADAELIKKATVPNRLLFLTHEFSHNFLNHDQDDETEADYYGLKLYLARGYPVIEAVYSFTSIFHDSEQSIKRLEWIDEFLKAHNLNYWDSTKP